MSGLAFKNPALKFEEELQERTSKFRALIPKLIFVKGIGTPTPVQISILVAKEVIIGFLVIIISIESWSSTKQGSIRNAFKVKTTRPNNLSAVPGR